MIMLHNFQIIHQIHILLSKFVFFFIEIMYYQTLYKSGHYAERQTKQQIKQHFGNEPELFCK